MHILGCRFHLPSPSKLNMCFSLHASTSSLSYLHPRTAFVQLGPFLSWQRTWILIRWPFVQPAQTTSSRYCIVASDVGGPTANRMLDLGNGLFLAAIVNNSSKGPLRYWSISYSNGCTVSLVHHSRCWIILPSRDSTLPYQNGQASFAEELNEVQAYHLYEMSLGKSTYADCFKGTLGKRLWTGCLLQSLQQLTGVNFIFYYGTRYFQNAGFKNPFIIQVITNCVNVASTFPGLYMVERLDHHNLLLMGAIGMCVCQYIVAITGTVSGTTDLPSQQTAIAFVCIYIFFFASSWGPVAWVVTGELFSLKARAKCLSMTTSPLFLTTDPSPSWFMIYETKGLSLEQVDELYGVVNKAWQSKPFRPQISFRDVDHKTQRHMSLTDIGQNQERKRSVQHEEVLPPAHRAGQKA